MYMYIHTCTGGWFTVCNYPYIHAHVHVLEITLLSPAFSMKSSCATSAQSL